MKTRAILILSLCVNVGLAGIYFLTRRPVAPAPAVTPEAPANSTPRPALEKRAQRSVAAADTAAGVADAFRWHSLESEDYRDYIENLRDIGCPEETIRDIIIADVNKLFGSRVAALYPAPRDFKFWRVEDRAARTEERERGQKRRELEHEKRDLIKELLGIDYDGEMARWDGRPDDEAWRFSFLTPERQQQVQALSNKYRDLERAAWGEGGRGNMTAETRAKLAALRSQREAELAQLLGPQDFDEYQLRNSNTARNMRDNLASFQPSEEEFRKVFDLRKAYDDQFGFTRDGGDAALREQRRLAQQQLEEQLRSTLGDQRHREYQLAQDERYRDTFEFTQRNNLPNETAQSLYDIRQTAETQREKIMNDRALSSEQRNAMLAAIAQETRRTLDATLPKESLNEYNRRQGEWLNRFSRVENNGRGGNDRDEGGGRGRPIRQ